MPLAHSWVFDSGGCSPVCQPACWQQVAVHLLLFWLFMCHGTRPLALQKSEGRARRAPHHQRWWHSSLVALWRCLQQQLLSGVFFGGVTQQDLLVFGLSWLLTLFTLIVGSWVLTLITPSNCPSVSGLSVCFVNTFVPSEQVKLILLRERLSGNPDLVLH